MLPPPTRDIFHANRVGAFHTATQNDDENPESKILRQVSSSNGGGYRVTDFVTSIQNADRDRKFFLFTRSQHLQGAARAFRRAPFDQAVGGLQTQRKVVRTR